MEDAVKSLNNLNKMETFTNHVVMEDGELAESRALASNKV